MSTVRSYISSSLHRGLSSDDVTARSSDRSRVEDVLKRGAATSLFKDQIRGTDGTSPLRSMLPNSTIRTSQQRPSSVPRFLAQETPVSWLQRRAWETKRNRHRDVTKVTSVFPEREVELPLVVDLSNHDSVRSNVSAHPWNQLCRPTTSRLEP